MTSEKVLDKYRRLCSRREYCTSELLQKTTKDLEGDTEAAAEVVAQLVADKYADDRRYASAFARDKAFLSGWGAVKIRYILSTKGIDKEIIEEVLAETAEDRKTGLRLEKLLDNKYKSLKDDPQWKLKLLRFALGRGYSYENVNEIIKKYE